MTDVVAVALISAGSSLLGASVGALTTYKVSRRNAETTVSMATSQHEVDMARIEAENQRLQQSNQEEERRNRQSTYHRYLDVLLEIFQLMGSATSPEQISEFRKNFRHLHAGVVLFGPPPVGKAAYKVAEIYSEMSPAVERERQENPGKPESECWRDGTAGIQDRFGVEIVNLTALMHADVTRGIADATGGEDRE